MAREEIVLDGIAASGGLAFGQALKLDRRQRLILKLYVPADCAEGEIARFHTALASSREQLARLKSRLAERVGFEHSVILDVHILMLEDRRIAGEIENLIRTECANAEWAVQRSSERLTPCRASRSRSFGLLSKWASRSKKSGSSSSRTSMKKFGYEPISPGMKSALSFEGS